ncbi:MAG: helix-turn-helix domain-containing protein [Thermacetogeniaceae bacterium]
MSESFGRKLRYLRKLRNLTAEELSKLSGVSRSYILLIESGKRKEVSSKVTAKLAKALRVNPDYFRIENASLPMEVLPDLPQEIIEMLLSADSMPYLKLTEKAKRHGLSPATLEKLIDILIEGAANTNTEKKRDEKAERKNEGE